MSCGHTVDFERQVFAAGRLRLLAIVTLAVALPEQVGAQIRPPVTPYEFVIEATAGATVSFDGRTLDQGDRGYIVRNPRPGEHVVRVTRGECMVPREQKVTIVEGQSSRIRVELSPRTGDLEVFTQAGAAVEVNGMPTGVADAKGELMVRGLPVCRDHRVRAALAGYVAEHRELAVSAEVITALTIELRPIGVTRADPPTQSAPEYRPYRRLVRPSGSEPLAVFSPDSRRLIIWARGDPVATLWDVETGRQLKEVGRGKDHRVLAPSRDLRLLAVTPEVGVVRVLDTQDGHQVAEVIVDSRGRIGNADRHVAFSPDGARLAVVSENIAGVWDVATATRIWALRIEPDAIASVAYTPDGRFLVTAGRGVAVWDADTGREVRHIARESDALTGEMALSPDGRSVAVRVRVPSPWPAEIWDLETGRFVSRFVPPRDSAFRDLAFTSDSRYLITATHDLSLHIWDQTTTQVVRTWPSTTKGDVSSFTVSPDGRWLVVCASRGEYVVFRRSD